MSFRRLGLTLLLMLIVGWSLPVPGRFVRLGVLRAQESLPPVSYICPMDADVVESVPGRCPICKMDLEPVRIDTAWSCPNHAAVITGKPGVCPIDRRELVPVTVSRYWTCPESGKTHLLEPSTCANGQPRKLEQAVRAHGDHNPRHGGQFFMAADRWHHLEGTYPRAGLFRVHFYDNFTKVLAAKGFSGRLALRDESDRELESLPLRISRDGLTMEADVRGAAAPSAGLPVRVTAHIAFKAGEPVQRFDFTFAELSKDPAVPTAPATASTSREPAKTASAGSARSSTATVTAPRRPAVSATADGSAVRSTPAMPASSPPPADPRATTPPAAAAPMAATSGRAAAAEPGAAPLLTDCKPTMSRLDAVAFGQTLPRASAPLLRLLSMCSAEVDTLIRDGQLGFVYQPSMLSKDIAIALEETKAELPSRQRGEAADAIRRVVLAAWMLDFYGDLGDGEKLADSYKTFAQAVADIKIAYGAKR